MARQRYYPDSIHRVHHDDSPSKRNTDLQLALADYLEDNWNDDADFSTIADDYSSDTQYSASRETVRGVYYSFFGPAGDPLDRSFEAIADDVREQLNNPGLSISDALDHYWRARGELDGETDITLPRDPDKEDAEIPDDVRDEIYQKAVQDTAQRMFEQGRKSVLEELPDEIVLEYFGRQALEYKREDGR